MTHGYNAKGAVTPFTIFASTQLWLIENMKGFAARFTTQESPWAIGWHAAPTLQSYIPVVVQTNMRNLPSFIPSQSLFMLAPKVYLTFSTSSLECVVPTIGSGELLEFRWSRQ